MLRIKRTYDPPVAEDGRRVLVERLWPRGMKKEALAADAWIKDVAPSTELRQWFGHRVERWEQFRREYEGELNAHPDAWRPILEDARHGTVTLLYSARDPAHNGALVLREYLAARSGGRTRLTERSDDGRDGTVARAHRRRSRPVSHEHGSSQRTH